MRIPLAVFGNANAFNHPLAFAVVKVTSMIQMFDGASALSDCNKRLIHDSLSASTAWAPAGYDWSTYLCTVSPSASPTALPTTTATAGECPYWERLATMADTDSIEYPSERAYLGLYKFSDDPTSATQTLYILDPAPYSTATSWAWTSNVSYNATTGATSEVYCSTTEAGPLTNVGMSLVIYPHEHEGQPAGFSNHVVGKKYKMANYNGWQLWHRGATYNAPSSPLNCSGCPAGAHPCALPGQMGNEGTLLTFFACRAAAPSPTNSLASARCGGAWHARYGRVWAVGPSPRYGPRRVACSLA